ITTRRNDTWICGSSGFARMRSIVPSLTCCTMRPMFGRSSASTTPATALNTPSSATTCQNPHPPSAVVCRKNTLAVSTAAPIQNTVPNTLATRFARYASSSARFADQNARSTAKSPGRGVEVRMVPILRPFCVYVYVHVYVHVYAYVHVHVHVSVNEQRSPSH